jgi:hypothetical protein
MVCRRPGQPDVGISTWILSSVFWVGAILVASWGRSVAVAHHVGSRFSITNRYIKVGSLVVI